MPRPRANLAARFSDVVPIWEQALDNNGLILEFATSDEAIHANFRLQMYRKAYRDTLTPEEISPLDLWVVRLPRGGRRVRLERRSVIRPEVTRTLDDELLQPEKPSGLGLEEV